jgi:hypothetical protein
MIVTVVGIVTVTVVVVLTRSALVGGCMDTYICILDRDNGVQSVLVSMMSVGRTMPDA